MSRSVSVMVLAAVLLSTGAPLMGQAASQPSDAASSNFASFAALINPVIAAR